MKVMSLLKQASATAGEHATEDQASDHSHQHDASRQEFDLDVTEVPPTRDQPKSIFEYSGGLTANQIIKGAKHEADARKKLVEDPESFQRPVVCLLHVDDPLLLSMLDRGLE